MSGKLELKSAKSVQLEETVQAVQKDTAEPIAKQEGPPQPDPTEPTVDQDGKQCPDPKGVGGRLGTVLIPRYEFKSHIVNVSSGTEVKAIFSKPVEIELPPTPDDSYYKSPGLE